MCCTCMHIFLCMYNVFFKIIIKKIKNKTYLKNQSFQFFLPCVITAKHSARHPPLDTSAVTSAHVSVKDVGDEDIGDVVISHDVQHAAVNKCFAPGFDAKFAEPSSQSFSGHPAAAGDSEVVDFGVMSSQHVAPSSSLLHVAALQLVVVAALIKPLEYFMSFDFLHQLTGSEMELHLTPSLSPEELGSLQHVATSL